MRALTHPTAGVHQRARHPVGALPGEAGAERRPGRGVEPGDARRVVQVHVPPLPPLAHGVADQVRLHARGQDRAFPLQHRWHGQAAGLLALGGPEHDDRLERLGRDQAPAEASQHDPGRLRAAHVQVAEQLRPRPPALADGAAGRRGVLHHHGARQPPSQGPEQLRQVHVGGREDQQGDCHHHVEGDRAGQQLAGRPGPRGRRVAHGSEEPGNDHAHVADRHPRPGAARVQEAGDLAAEPQKEGRTERERHRDEHHLLGIALALDRRLAAHWSSSVTRLPRRPCRSVAAPPTAPSEGPCWRRCRRSRARSSSRFGAGR